MVLNGTINETLNSTNLTGSLANGTINTSTIDTAKTFLPFVFLRLFDLLAAPFRYPEMLWIIFPLFFTFFVMEFYFDRHNDEELGWGAAVANSLVLFIVAIDLLKHSFDYASPWVVLREITLSVFGDQILPLEPQVLILILFLGIMGVAITLINYFHLLPRRMAFVISGHPPVNFLAYFAIAIVYTTGTPHEIPFDIPTLLAGAILFVLILIVVFSFKRMVQRITGRNKRRF